MNSEQASPKTSRACAGTCSVLCVVCFSMRVFLWISVSCDFLGSYSLFDDLTFLFDRFSPISIHLSLMLIVFHHFSLTFLLIIVSTICFLLAVEKFSHQFSSLDFQSSSLPNLPLLCWKVWCDVCSLFSHASISVEFSFL